MLKPLTTTAIPTASLPFVAALVCVFHLCTSISRAQSLRYTSLEFNDLGISFEVPETWFTFDNGSSKLVSKVAAELLSRIGEDTDARTLISIIDNPDVHIVDSSSISVLYLPDIIATQAQIANANDAQRKILLDYWNEDAPEKLRKIAQSVKVFGDGDIVKVGEALFVKVSMEVKMRADIPSKRKDVYIHMSEKGTIQLSFSCVPEKFELMAKIQNYVLESLRMNALRRAQ
jgi:hypothetical protein